MAHVHMGRFKWHCLCGGSWIKMWFMWFMGRCDFSWVAHLEILCFVSRCVDSFCGPWVDVIGNG
jgi:hypothetical protein